MTLLVVLGWDDRGRERSGATGTEGKRKKGRERTVLPPLSAPAAFFAFEQCVAALETVAPEGLAAGARRGGVVVVVGVVVERDLDGYGGRPRGRRGEGGGLEGLGGLVERPGFDVDRGGGRGRWRGGEDGHHGLHGAREVGMGLRLS